MFLGSIIPFMTSVYIQVSSAYNRSRAGLQVEKFACTTEF